MQDPVAQTCSKTQTSRTQILEGSNTKEGWITPKRTQNAKTLMECKTETHNSYTPLETVLESSEQPSFCEETSFKSEIKEPKTIKNKLKLEKNNEASQVDEQLWKPHEPSYFLPGKIGRCTAKFLIDTGCTTNLLAKHVFDKLPRQIKDEIQSHESHGIMADGTRLPFYGLIKAPIRLRDIKTEETFVVSGIKEDAILGMPFLKENKCIIEFEQSTINIGLKSLQCTDRLGRLLTNKVQVVRQTVLPPSTESHVICRINTQAYPPVGVVERSEGSLLVATSLNCPNPKGQMVVRCLNPTDQPVTINAGSVIGTYTGVEEQEIMSQGHVNTVNSEQLSLTHSDNTDEVPRHLQSLFDAASKNCTEKLHRDRLAKLLKDYSTVFSTGEHDVGRTHLVEHSIPLLENTRPIRQPPHRLGPEKEAEAERQIEDLLKRGFIEPAGGAWSSPVVLVRKKDGSWRFCIDYRRLNAVTRQDAYPLPRIDESLDALSGSKFFSTLDLVSGYWQVPLDADAQEKSAFSTRGGLWKWKVLPFGLTSAPATFQRLMEKVLQGLHWKTVLLYLDDIIVISPDLDTHLQRLTEVFERLQSAGLKLKPSKCELFQTEVKYLGHIVSSKGVATDPQKVMAVKEWPTPTKVKDIKSFLGTVGYYHQYIPHFATIAKPLTQLTSKNAVWSWGEQEQTAFERLKQSLITAPILGYPHPKSTYILDTDASLDGVGAVLSQQQNGTEKVIAYFSKTLGPAEKNYCVTRKELLAIVKAVKHFRPYLYGRQFLLRTDHASLIWLCRRKEPTSQVARWIEILSEFSYTLEHRPGTKHGNADGLSRRPCIDCKQCSKIEQRDGGPCKQEIIQELHGQTTSKTLQVEDNSLTDSNVHELETDLMSLKEIVELQQDTSHAVGQMYRSIQTKIPITDEQINVSNAELRQLTRIQENIMIREDGVLIVKLNHQGRIRQCVICPPPIRNSVIWTTHIQTHSGIERTLSRIRINWYWYGMTSQVRRAVLSCEICQMAKNSSTNKTNKKQRLYCGRPWQKVAIDLVGPMPITNRGNQWILVLTDHFTRWQDALAIPDATAPTVAETLDERVFAYLGLPEQIHSDQGAQFQSTLMNELCQLWHIGKTKTTPYHPQSNGVVERNNRKLGDSLRTLLINSGQEEWDTLLPQIMRSFRGIPHSMTKETANFLMLGRELRLPDQLQYPTPLSENTPVHQYVQDMQEKLHTTHELLREMQKKIKNEDEDEPPLFATGELVWLLNKRKRRGHNSKLVPKFLGPYKVLEVYPNHTYKISRHGQESIQNESRLKPYKTCDEFTGQAPTILEPTRRPNMKGAISKGNPKLPIDAEITNEDTDIHHPFLLPEATEDKLLQDKSIETATTPTVCNDKQGIPTNGTVQQKRVIEPATKEIGENFPKLVLDNVNRPQRTRKPPNKYSDFVKNFEVTVSTPAATHDCTTECTSVCLVFEPANQLQPSINKPAQVNDLYTMECKPANRHTMECKQANQILPTVDDPSFINQQTSRLAMESEQLNNLLEELANDCQESKSQVCTLSDLIEGDMASNPAPKLDNLLVPKTNAENITNTTVAHIIEEEPLQIEEDCKEFEKYLDDLEDEELQEKKVEKRQWVSQETKTRMELAGKDVRLKCYICKLVTSRKALQRHVKIHFVKYYCKCGFSSQSRDYVAKHKKGCKNNDDIIYEVDRETYAEWAKHVNLLDNNENKENQQHYSPRVVEQQQHSLTRRIDEDHRLEEKSRYVHSRHHPYIRHDDRSTTTNNNNNIRNTLRCMEQNVDELHAQIRDAERNLDKLRRLARSQEQALRDLQRQLAK